MSEQIFDRIQSSFESQKFLSLIGARLESAQEGEVKVTCSRREDLTQQQSLLHGGVIMTLADVSCGYAALSVMPEGLEVLTAECKVNLLRPAQGERFVATGSVVKAGRTLIVTEAEVCDADTGKTVAKMLATMIPTKLKR